MITEFFNNLNTFSTSLYESGVGVLLIRTVSVFLLNTVSYLYIMVKFYKVLCYSKMTFEWLPMINPYVWPFSVFQVLTGPYFAFWSRVLPSIKFERSSVEISGIIALESLNSLIDFCVKVTNMLIVMLEETEKTLAGQLIIPH